MGDGTDSIPRYGILKVIPGVWKLVFNTPVLNFGFDTPICEFGFIPRIRIFVSNTLFLKLVF